MQTYLITGSNTGVGWEVARLLYAKHGRVYMTARSEEKAKAAIESIMSAHPSSSGTLRYLHLDLSNLSAVRRSAEGIQI